jgi:hypothetical protein
MVNKMQSIKILDNKWQIFLDRNKNILTECEVCGKKMKMLNFYNDEHYKRKHLLWYFCLKSGILYKIEQFKNILRE